jgi:protein-L-isoaspartate(D-aspartate) O-methyltransferase
MKKEELIRSLRLQKFPEKIINAFQLVERREFITEEYSEYAYEDIPLPIGEGQTISQPYTIAFMLTLLGVTDRQKILEIGSGSGYALALLSKLNSHGKIIGIERLKMLVIKSREALRNYKNVVVMHGDGTKGLIDEAPFDRILISASTKTLPQKLLKQLKLNGIMVVPIENTINVIKKTTSENKIKEYPGFSFVPLV